MGRRLHWSAGDDSVTAPVDDEEHYQDHYQDCQHPDASSGAAGSKHQVHVLASQTDQPHDQGRVGGDCASLQPHSRSD